MPLPIFDTHAHGKLLLTGEYFVLDGALALALPVRFGQRLRATRDPASPYLSWTSRDHDGTVWFEAEYERSGLAVRNSSDEKTARTLADMLNACRRLNPGFLHGETGFGVGTGTDFPRAWGLGTSSTLIAALARWAAVDAYTVLFDTLGGSGYDIACAYADGPILYRLRERTPEVNAVDYRPDFSGSLYFVYLGKKQDSREGIARYRRGFAGKTALVEEITQLTRHFLSATTLSALNAVIREHEALVSRALDLPRARDVHFRDFEGEVKSLGAWGGDFVLLTSERSEAETRVYLSGKGFGTVLTWPEMAA